MSSSVVRALKGCLAKCFICSMARRLERESRLMRAHPEQESRSGITPRGLHVRLPYSGSAANTNR
jgi:hypothetical protein